MKQCTICGNIIDDSFNECNRCGGQLVMVSYYNEINTNQQMGGMGYVQQPQYNQQTYYQPTPQQYQQQMYMNQQLIEQQRMLNTMLEQQQKMNQQIKQQPQYVYVPTRVQATAELRNIWSLIAAVICIVSLFVGVIAGGNLMDISSITSDLIEYGEGWEKFGLIMITVLPWDIIALAVTLIVGGFSKQLEIRKLFIFIQFLGIFSLLSLIAEIWGRGFEFSDLETGFWVLVAGFVLALIAGSTDSGPSDTSIYAPRRSMGNGVSDSNSRSLESIARESDQGKWICPKCDVKNTGAICKVCGGARP